MPMKEIPLTKEQSDGRTNEVFDLIKTCQAKEAEGVATEESMAVTAESFADLVRDRGEEVRHSKAVSACQDALATARAKMDEAKAREVRKLLRTTNGGA